MTTPINFVKISLLKHRILGIIKNSNNISQMIMKVYSQLFGDSAFASKKIVESNGLADVVGLITHKAVENEEKISQFIALGKELFNTIVEITDSPEAKAFGTFSMETIKEVSEKLDNDYQDFPEKAISNQESANKLMKDIINIWTNKEVSNEN